MLCIHLRAIQGQGSPWRDWHLAAVCISGMFQELGAVLCRWNAQIERRLPCARRGPGLAWPGLSVGHAAADSRYEH
jgi:hypothetical protein